MIPRMRLPALAAVTLLLGFAAMNTVARAVMPGEMLSDPALEARARALSQELRCLVCQNQSIDDSNAPLARDLRVILRERLRAGDSDGQAMAYLQARYGNFVLLKPPFELSTALLWLGPALILTAAGGIFLGFARRAQSQPDAALPPLTELERQQIAALTGDAPR